MGGQATSLKAELVWNKGKIMQRDVYERMSVQEGEHWWFVGRRANLDSLIKTNFAFGSQAKVLEAGCGSGGNLELLSQFGQVEAFEFDDYAREVSVAKGIAEISPGELPSKIDYPDDRFDMIAMLDVLEHIENDVSSLRTLSRKLKNDGQMLLTVPAMPWLWSDHDEAHHHYRRYTKSSLQAVLDEAGLKVNHIGYFNSLLFPVALIQRTLNKLLGKRFSNEDIPDGWLNKLLAGIFRSERHFITKVPMPFGLSVYAIVERA